MINDAVKEGNVKITDDFQLVESNGNNKESNIPPQWSVDAELKGFTFNLTNADAIGFSNKTTNWAIARTAVTGIAGWLGTKGVPHVAGVALASTLVTAGLQYASNQVSQNNNGNGVEIYVSNFKSIQYFQRF